MIERSLPHSVGGHIRFSGHPSCEDLTKGFSGIAEVEEELQPWKVDQVMITFLTQLKELDGQIRYPRLTMRKKTIIFVNFDDIQAKTDEERYRLANVYGDYIVDNVAGNHIRNPDGSHTIRIGFAGQENIKSKNDVLAVMSHEFGHGVGRKLEDPILEELKAETFANLFMKKIHGVKELKNCFIGKASNVHETALTWLSDLLDNGFSEEDILAHLTGKRFGSSYPKNYIKFLNVISSNISRELKFNNGLIFLAK